MDDFFQNEYRDSNSEFEETLNSHHDNLQTIWNFIDGELWQDIQEDADKGCLDSYELVQNILCRVSSNIFFSKLGELHPRAISEARDLREMLVELAS